MSNTFGYPTSDDPYHEVCPCEACHKAGCHDDPAEWYKTVSYRVGLTALTRWGCEDCKNWIDEMNESPRGDDYQEELGDVNLDRFE